MKHYELLLISRPQLSETEFGKFLGEVKDLVKNNDGEVTAEDNWGKRHLAYSIKGQADGNFAVLDFFGPPKLPRVLEKRLLIDGNLLRFLLAGQD